MASFRNIVVRTVAVAAIALTAGCAELNPASSVTHDADLDANSSKEILQNFPGAKNIKVTHADDNPNIMKWNMPDGKVCTAFASQTLTTGGTPGELIAEPYCRPALEISG